MMDMGYTGVHYRDGAQIRHCAIENGITMLTSLDTVKVPLDVLEETTMSNIRELFLAAEAGNM